MIVKPKPTVSQAQADSTTRRPLIYGVQDDNSSDMQNFALDLTPPPDVLVRTREGTSDGMNVLGIVIFSAIMGKLSIQLPSGPAHERSVISKAVVCFQASCWEEWDQMAVPWSTSARVSTRLSSGSLP